MFRELRAYGPPSPPQITPRSSAEHSRRRTEAAPTPPQGYQPNSPKSRRRPPSPRRRSRQSRDLGRHTSTNAQIKSKNPLKQERIAPIEHRRRRPEGSDLDSPWGGRGVRRRRATRMRRRRRRPVSLRSPTAPRSASVNCEVVRDRERERGRDACESFGAGGRGSGGRARWAFSRTAPVVVTLLREWKWTATLGGEVGINCLPLSVVTVK
jgi:hypothetical protein